MKDYVSTRDTHQKVSSKQAILNGISPDGGLYVLPDLDSIHLNLHTICSQSYIENAVYILSHLLTDYTMDELKECVTNAYSHSFSTPKITPIKKVGGIYVLELFHGPTCAFKDVALTLLPQLMSCALKSTHQKALILTATSGDTGKAALNGFCDIENIGIDVFYPYQKVSAIQYRQMVTQKGKNVRVFGVHGNFDDAQSQVKQLFLDVNLKETCQKEKILLTSANSINIGRLVPQIVYYFDSYKQLVDRHEIELGDFVSFSVPTGNFGDVLAGYYAYMMGLPVRKFYVASNANHVLTDFLTTGIYNRNRDFIQTISPSMDILISSNLERLLYYASNKNTVSVKKWMQDLKDKGYYQVDENTLNTIQSLFSCAYVDDECTKKTIHDVYEKTKYVLDPHSAIAYKVAKDARETPIIALATASPYKFSQDVLASFHQNEPDEFKAMQDLSKICQDAIPTSLNVLQNLNVLHSNVIDINEMKDYVLQSTKECFHD